jgi:hypothetical protein
VAAQAGCGRDVLHVTQRHVPTAIAVAAQEMHGFCDLLDDGLESIGATPRASGKGMRNRVCSARVDVIRDHDTFWLAASTVTRGYRDH